MSDKELESQSEYQDLLKIVKTAIEDQNQTNATLEILKAHRQGLTHLAMRINYLYEENIILSPLTMDEILKSVNLMSFSDDCKTHHHEVI